MDRELFRSRFLEGATTARDFAQRHVEETLPPSLRFHVHLNRSYDANASPDFVLFPEDSSTDLAARLKHLPLEEAVDALWRGGLVPQWVNLSVVAETGTATVIEVVACGRFTADEANLYHLHEGRPPFHVLGPTLPVGYESGRFSRVDW